jgi:hypothetical protein|tara:strand:+ start:299 stop:2296 length:1998 start_codon:yes stop_codon:yes gene_type:complete
MNLAKVFLKKKILTSFNNPILRNKLLLELRDLELSVRALNALLNQNLNTIKDLIELTEGELKRFPNMGQTSINQIKEMLDNYSLYLGMEIPDLNDEANIETINSIEVKEEDKLIEISEEKIIELIKEFDETTLSVRSKNVLKNLNCTNIGDIIFLSGQSLLNNNNLGKKSVNEIEEYINNLDLNFGDIIEPWDKDIVKQLRENLIGKISDEARQELIKKNQYLEVELQKILEECIKTSQKDQSIKDRVIDVLINRFGLDGSPAKTLEIIGQKYNVTRERIRQNQENGLRKLKTFKPFTPILDKIFEELSKSLPVTEIEFNRILKEKKLTLVEWDFKGLQDFYENIGIKTDFYITKVNTIKIITNNSKDFIAQQLLTIINKQISRSGLFSISKCMELKEIYLNDVKSEIIKKILLTKANFNWLDDEQNWFTYQSQRNRLTNLISKAATASKNQNIKTLYNSVKKNSRLERDLIFSQNIFINFCKVAFDTSIDDFEHIIFNSLKPKISNFKGREGQMIAPNEQKMMNIFNDYGPILYIDDLKELAILQDIKSDSLTMMLQYSPLFYRIDKGFYTLIGKKMDNKEEKLISVINLESSTFSKDECPTSKGKITYVEVNKNETLYKALPYPRPMRTLPDGLYGVVYKKKVYPVMKLFKEINKKRIEEEIS